MSDALTYNPKMLAQALKKRNWVLDQSGFPIDLNRPVINNPDGSISTERSMTENVDGRWYNYPSIVNGVQQTPENAFNEFTAQRNKGYIYPNFSTLDEAEKNAILRSQLIGTLRNGNRS
jgi:hypothetical protein